MNAINPLRTAEAVTGTYGLYLKSLIKPKNPTLVNALNKCIDDSIKAEGGIVKGPFIEATPPYVKGLSIDELVAEGVLSKEFLQLNSNSMPTGRHLYKHQEEAIRKVALKRNVLVATGTGSGKTESFLIPIINELMREKEQGELGPGVRALLLYPMNALANDQVKRIREILENYPQITFGRYTGETKETEKEAKAAYLLAEGKENLPNELISRETIRATPPQILLTNYAMLEYLLLRPDDVELFKSHGSSKWKFIVADEAHTYDGAHGIEVSTLLRKLRERVDKSKTIQTIGTTATIGGTNAEIERFAENFFGNSFSIDVPEGHGSDLVKPVRAVISAGSWGPVSPEIWTESSSSRELASKFGVIEAELFEKFQSEANVSKLRQSLLDLPKSLSGLSVELFGDDSELNQFAITQMIELGAKIRNADSIQALSARFHLFARSTEGIFGCLSAEPHLYLNRRHTCDVCDKPAFEYAGCNRCGAAFFIGYEEVFEGKKSFKSESPIGQPIYVSVEDIFLSNDNEDDEIDEDDAVQGDDPRTFFMCVHCGEFAEKLEDLNPNCPSESKITVRSQLERTKCLACGGQGRPAIRKLESGNDAAASVLATEMYQHMPPAQLLENDEAPGEGRKIMVFSDNRQQAAYFAPYIEDRYEKILWRKVIFQALQKLHASNPDETGFQLSDLVSRVVSLAKDASIFDSSLSAVGRSELAKQRIHFEVVNTESQNNLEGIGLMEVSVSLSDNPDLYAAFSRYNLEPTMASDLIQELLATLRLGGIMTFDDGVQVDSDLFKPRTGPLYIRQTDPKTKSKIYSWVPGGKNNTRLDFVQRVLNASGSSADATEVLENIWKSLTHPSGLFTGTLISKNIPINGVVFQLNHQKVLLSKNDENSKMFQCQKCGRTSPRNVLDVCPRYKCDGKLALASAEVLNRGVFYSRQYKDSSVISMVAKEHTAQLTTDEARDIQNDFIKGKVNLLSSSTTFELGVDVGELQSVFLRNVPPSVANYLQRAGRAGRRADSAALILTYAQRKPHDLSKYADPVSLVSGKMRAPFVELENERILQRHIYSLFFAEYFQYANFSGRMKAGAFYLTDTGEDFAVQLESWLTTDILPVTLGDNHAKKMLLWLNSNKETLEPRFRSILPGVLKERADELWKKTCSDFKDLILSVLEKFHEEVVEYSQLMRSSYDRNDGFRGNRLKGVLIGILNKDMISNLSRSNLIPKYGFPVDTVSLQPRHQDSNAFRVELDRDLSIAIFEYAPGSTVVAAGYNWESIGLSYVPNKEFKTMQYASCPNCGHFNEKIETSDQTLSNCAECQDQLPKSKKYLIPEWGFIATGGSKKPGDAPRMVSTQGRNLYLASYGQDSDQLKPQKLGDRVTARLRTIADLVVVNSGPNVTAGKGFGICPNCKAAFDGTSKIGKKHSVPSQPDRSCDRELMDWYHLGHKYQSDIVLLEIDFSGTQIQPKDYTKVCGYSLLEGASKGLQIAHDDIDVISLPPKGSVMNVALVDAVPAGAGFAKLIANNIAMVFETAQDIVTSCECGLDTSCYECLRNYRNQREHDSLVRSVAIEAFKSLGI